jgi:PilZ domain
MSSPQDLRAFERVPVNHEVKITSTGRFSARAMATNLSMGGILLAASGALPIGSHCEVAIQLPDRTSLDPIQATGRVVRSDLQGVAIQFSRPLEPKSFEVLTKTLPVWSRIAVFKAYSDYFRVSLSENYENCETLLGVSKQTFRSVFLASFFTCILAAVIPVWFLRQSFHGIPVWGRILGSFGYGILWLGAIQPTVDVLAFRFLRHRAHA